MKQSDMKSELRNAILRKDVSKVERILAENRQLRSHKRSKREQKKSGFAQMLTAILCKINPKKNHNQSMERKTHDQ